MNSSTPKTICWLRRDLRLHDQAALYHALKSPYPVQLLFIFDTNILSKLNDRTDARVNFIHQQLQRLKLQLQTHGADLWVEHGKPEAVWEKLLQNHTIREVHTNHDYEPYALQRDKTIGHLLASRGIKFYTWKDQVIFEKDEVLSATGKPYTIYTPYSRAWLQKLNAFYIKPYPVEKYLHNLAKTHPVHMPDLKSIGFAPTHIAFPPEQVADKIIREYAATRNTPSLDATSHLGIHLRFGTISIRELVAHVKNLSETYLKELIWREFFMQILWHHPHVVHQSFKKQYDAISWRNNETEFKRWCNGETGYPMVDAGMRELNETGFMHNRVRMITASFLCKHLLIDWRWGEAYFAEKLLDFELASNNGNWQWAAGTGCDAAPYFRIFNPTEQQKKFDPQGIYIRRWVKDLDSFSYPKPMVEHKMARERALATYKAAVNH
jgi:deoxyribodipyrimidine photo-lyase